MSILVWAMIGIAMWHFAVLVPDKFTGGIIGAFLAAVAGALAAGYLLPSPGVPSDNPPGFTRRSCASAVSSRGCRKQAAARDS